MSIEEEIKNIEKNLDGSSLLEKRTPFSDKNLNLQIKKRNDVFLEGIDDQENTPPLGFKQTQGLDIKFSNIAKGLFHKSNINNDISDKRQGLFNKSNTKHDSSDRTQNEPANFLYYNNPDDVQNYPFNNFYCNNPNGAQSDPFNNFYCNNPDGTQNDLFKNTNINFEQIIKAQTYSKINDLDIPMNEIDTGHEIKDNIDNKLDCIHNGKIAGQNQAAYPDNHIKQASNQFNTQRKSFNENNTKKKDQRTSSTIGPETTHDKSAGFNETQTKNVDSQTKNKIPTIEDLQKELDTLKDIHHRMFSVKGKIYQAVEKEINRFKTQMKNDNEKRFQQNKEEIEKLHKQIEILIKEKESLWKECEELKEERDKFQIVYCKLKAKMKALNGR